MAMDEAYRRASEKEDARDCANEALVVEADVFQFISLAVMQEENAGIALIGFSSVAHVRTPCRVHQEPRAADEEDDRPGVVALDGGGRKQHHQEDIGSGGGWLNQSGWIRSAVPPGGDP